LQDIEEAFEKHISSLWNIRKHILDVKATRWHDDYNTFKQGVKDLEIMMQNLIISAFENSANVEKGVELLCVFHQLAKRDAIKRTIEKKTTDIYQLLVQEFNSVKAEFETNRKTPLILRTQPDYSDSVYWAKSLLKRVQSPMNTLSEAYFLPTSILAPEAKHQFEIIVASIEEYISKTHLEWINSIPENLPQKLNDVLMARRGDLIQIQFDKDLTRLFAEINYFTKQKGDIPFHLQELNSKKDELRILRENVLLVTRDYNGIIGSLNPQEHLLFRERIRFIDRKVNPGLTSLNWYTKNLLRDSKGVADFFIKECRRHLIDVQQTANEFLDCSLKINQQCQLISNTMLWQIEKKKVYDLDSFEPFQAEYQSSIRAKLSAIHGTIVDTLQGTFEIFRNDGPNVYAQWVKYIELIDSKVEQALRVSVKRSLNEISRAINGEAKNREGGSEIHPLFKVNVVLDAQKVDFNPTFSKLHDTINKISREMISVISVFGRLTQALTPEVSTVPSLFYDIISSEEDVLKIFVNIQTGMSQNTTKCLAYLHNWDSYKEIWEINKDAFIRRYAKLKPALSTFDADINRYNEVASNAQKEETLSNINFVRLDCSLLKHSIVSHCNSWQTKLTTLLNQNATTELYGLLEMFETNTAKLNVPPKDLDQLSGGILLLSQLQEEFAKIEAQFAPISEMYAILENYEVQVKPEEKEKLQNLPLSWQQFQETIESAVKQLNESKSRFKNDLITSADDFKRITANLKTDFYSKGPFTAAIGYDKASKSIAEYQKSYITAITQEKSLKRGLAVFKIEQIPSKELELVNIDLENLNGVWTATQDWNNLYSQWRTNHFLSLDSSEIEDSVQKFVKRIGKMNKEVKEWDVYLKLKDKIQQTKRTIPLLLDLRNPAMRDRHWNSIMDDIGKTFSTSDSSFTLDKIFELGLDQQTESISALSTAASKELSIEQGLQSISDAWNILDIEIGPYKEEKGYYKIKSTDSVFELLEDNQVTLSTMKASKFFKAFETQVDRWEKNLSLVVEVIEVLLQVQKQWMYLENIFVGTEDIRKQLPKESAMFDNVNQKFKVTMNQILKNKNVLSVSQTPNLLEELLEMNLGLEKIQKSLDMYLETKRQSFPRFYFLSNDDLLEILGQAKDPNSVQPHLKKCFDNLYKLELAMAGTDSRRHNEAIGMHSGDGEYVPFINPVIVEGPVEMWLTDIESMMISTLRKLMGGCLSNLKKAKKDKWLKDWAGMLLIAAGLIQWTANCTKALQDIEKGDKNAMKVLKKKQISSLKKFADLVRLPIGKIDRKKLIALITIEVHSRDVIERMVKSNCSSVNAFEWLSQLRFYWDEECYIRQINTSFKFGYEYLGNSGRLVITPLTDRCYMTLTTALHLFRGGSPQGPAGTGKTETVKDLGKGLGKYVIVFNCSDALDYKSIGRMFSGLVQTGAWYLMVYVGVASTNSIELILRC
jgi:dynein heavy chain